MIIAYYRYLNLWTERGQRFQIQFGLQQDKNHYGRPRKSHSQFHSQFLNQYLKQFLNQFHSHQNLSLCGVRSQNQLGDLIGIHLRKMHQCPFRTIQQETCQYVPLSLIFIIIVIVMIPIFTCESLYSIVSASWKIQILTVLIAKRRSTYSKIWLIQLLYVWKMLLSMLSRVSPSAGMCSRSNLLMETILHLEVIMKQTRWHITLRWHVNHCQKRSQLKNIQKKKRAKLS